MQAGKMNCKLTFQSFTTTRDTNGEELKTWTDYATVSAQKMSKTGREFYNANKVNSEVNAVYKIRYNSAITLLMRFKEKGNFYDIAFLDNVEDRNHELLIAAKEVE